MSFFKFQYSPTLVTSFLSFQFLPSVCCQVHHFVTSVLMFLLIYKVPSLLLPFRFSSYTSYSLFVTLILSLQFFPFIRYISLSLWLFPLLFPSFRRSAVPFVSTLSFHSFFCGVEQSGLVFAIQAATCGHLQPLPAATCGHLWPLAATCGHLRPLAATCSSGHSWPLVATCGHLLQLRPLAATCDHLRPLKWLQAAAFL